ncbi:MMPL family transporter [Actinoplanes teichomyceticus]|uniref:RND superfamily putative drug exporter n=1 Tax=Actinoplanes teichomyceticus TaxID=1867 RepID=A0A561WSK2_ACTTI|nr:MMPL family transporter [Actinoplanes teichomyceticus]TWG26842.1 RND superfamily putative drug exporter [Actinoplanes teichomyceticus]GIF15241.1 membrane protein [Actinoplanes teichomyceticus]
MEHRGKVKGIAARAALWSARHRMLAILGWIAFVAGTVVLSGQLGTREASFADQGSGDSGRAEKIVEGAGFPERPAGEMVLIQSRAGSDRGPATAEVSRTLSGLSDVTDVQPPIQSPDGRSTLIAFSISGDPATAKDRVGPALDAVARVQSGHPDLFIAEAGDASGDKLIGDELEAGLSRLSMLSIPVTLGILLVAFGAVVAALLPVGLAVTAVVAAIGLMAAGSRLAPTVDATSHVMLLVGLAVGVDYCLFYIRRERDERRAGAGPDRALMIAAQTSGRSIWISGLTVIVAMAGMFLTRDTTFVSFGLGTILVVATAVLGSLTVLPALLSALGDRVDAIKIPGLYRRRSDGRLWNGLLRAVLARPLISVVVALGVLGALAAPVLDLRTRGEVIEDLSPRMPVVQAYRAIGDAFPSKTTPAEVVVRAPTVRGERFERALADFRAAVGGSGGRLVEPVDVRINPAGTVAVVSVGLTGHGDDRAAVDALKLLRGEVVPAAFGRLPGATALVSGETAGSVDFNGQLERSLPWVFGFVLGLAFLLLLVSFRSVTVAITGVVLNLISVAAAYGMLVYVFQYGHFEKQLDFTASAGITNWIPLFLFVILFGLSMDYHVFVLSRIREGHDRGLPTRQAVREGIGRTAGVITSAAVVMVAVFALFATLPLTSTKELGVGLAAAVLLDATIIRAVLLPAVMALLGRANWWLPGWLNWLPQVAHELPAEVAATPARRPLTPVG